MKTYRIICSTDAYHASHKPQFAKGETSYIYDEGLTLTQANNILLDLFNEEAINSNEEDCQSIEEAAQERRGGYGMYINPCTGLASLSLDIFEYEIEEEQVSSFAVHHHRDYRDNEWWTITEHNKNYDGYVGSIATDNGVDTWCVKTFDSYDEAERAILEKYPNAIIR